MNSGVSEHVNRRSFLKIASAASLAVPAWIAAQAEPIVASRAGLIFLTVAVGGQTAKALIDTGAVRGLQLSAAFAARLGLALADSGQTTQRYDGSHPVTTGRVGSLLMAGRRMNDVEVAVSPGDIENISSQIGEPFDAIIGWPLLSSEPFVIDYLASSLEWRSEPPAAGILLPLTPTKRLPVTGGRIAGGPVDFLVDTGAPNCNVDVGLVSGGRLNDRVELPFELGGETFTTMFRIRDLTAMTRGVGARAVIGHRFLQGFRFCWDKRNGAIRLLANPPR